MSRVYYERIFVCVTVCECQGLCVFCAVLSAFVCVSVSVIVFMYMGVN